jgi:hypothetical protein
MSGDDAGALLDAERTRISHIEAGRVDVPRNGLYKLLRAYGCPDGPYFEGLMNMAMERGKGWWDDFRDVLGRNALDLAELEYRCHGIRIHQPLFIPGMFQTEDYAHAVTLATGQEPEHLDRFVEYRLTRQRILTDPKPVPYHAVIHEAALRVQVGGSNTMRRQLLRLIEIARLPNVTLQLFPFEQGAYAAFSRPFVLFAGASAELNTVYLEHPLNSAFLDGGVNSDEYGKMFERLTELALDPVDPESKPESHDGRDSLSLLQHIMYDL